MVGSSCQCREPEWCVNANKFEDLQQRVSARQNQQIRLKRHGTYWQGEHFVDGRPDPYITCLFGTHIIPLPFTRRADDAMMVAYRYQLGKAWPHHQVILNGE